MSKRTWPDDSWPTGEQLLEWCRTTLTAEAVSYLDRLLDAAAESVRDLEGSGDPARFITVQEAADMMTVSHMTVRRMIGSGRLRGYKFGRGSIRVRRNDVHALIRDAARWMDKGTRRR